VVHGDSGHTIFFTFSQFYPGEGSMKEEQKCDIPCDENGPNVDGVR
jgi:hypothetical protein